MMVNNNNVTFQLSSKLWLGMCMDQGSPLILQRKKKIQGKNCGRAIIGASLLHW
jgi:hypothetical protein